MSTARVLTSSTKSLSERVRLSYMSQTLVGTTDAPSSEDGQEASRAVDVVRLLGAVLAESPHNRQSMVQISGAQHCRILCLLQHYRAASMSLHEC